MLNINNQLRILVQLAHADGKFAEEEKELIHKIGQANFLDHETVDDIINHPDPVDITHMTADDKFELMVTMMKLVKIDKKVYKSELKFCEQVAKNLGYKRKVVKLIFQHIYSDPDVNTQLDSLKPKIQKYLAA